jgi:hypothetical protein
MVPSYEAAPVLGSFLRLSSGGSLAHEGTVVPRDAAAALLNQDVRFIVLNRATSPPDLLEYVGRLPLRRIAADGDRELWLVEDRR